MAVRPPHDPAQPARAGTRGGLRVQDRARARVLPPPPRRRRRARARRPARRPREALLRPPRPDAELRLPHDGLALCNELGWGNYANDHEDANGQFEQNFTYDDALVSCDRAIFFRYMVHTLAQQRGLLATFMPKPFTHLTGNGCHFHMSLWRDGDNAFLDEDDPRGLGLSETAYHFVGGLKAHARASSALTAPTVNSYKRLKLGSTTSGATWSPVWISTATTTARRCCGSRGPDASRTAHRRLVQPVPRRHGRARRGARRDRAEARPGRAEHREPLHGLDRRAALARASRRSRRRSARRSASSSGTTCCVPRSGAAATRTSSTGSPASSATSGIATTSR